VSDENALAAGEELKIEISADREAKTLTIRDTGVGMTKADLIANLGTVAKSGTTNFAEALSGEGDISLIGQFGVGFYSVYLVADRVRVRSKHNDDDQHIWESTADSNFYVVADPEGSSLGRGTEITLFLKEDALEFTGEKRLEELIKRYSEFITFPIYLQKEKTVTVDVEDDDEDEELLDDEDEDDDEETDEEADEDAEDDEEEDAPAPKTETITTFEWERINSNQAIWARSPDDITDEEYKNFYKSISNDYDETLAWTHFKAEGEVEFRSILYIPTSAPPGMYDNYYANDAALRLYVRKVLISDDFEELLPKYLNFIKGVVDSDDLPLNVSRETLQQHKILKVMRKKLVRKVLEMLRKLAQKGVSKDTEEDEDEEEDAQDLDAVSDYEKFWETFGKNIKLGIVEDNANRNKLLKLLRFKTSKSDGEWRSVEDYVEDMKEWQEDIYYISGESIEAVEKSPFLERLREKDLEVIYFVDPLDEYAVQHVTDFEGRKLQSVSKEGLQFGDEDEAMNKAREKAYKELYEPLTGYLKETLKGKVSKVTVSNRVTASPVVIVTSQYGNSANMERIMKAQAFGDNRLGYMKAQKTLEINPRHPMIAELNGLAESAPTDQHTIDLVNLLYDTALVTSGFQLEEIEDYSGRMYRTLRKTLGIESDALLDEIDIPEPEEASEPVDEDEEDLDEVGEEL